MDAVLNQAVTVTASAAGTATARIGPDSGKGPAVWQVRAAQVRNENAARRGVPPIPTCNLYVDNSDDPGAWVSGTYDGSFDVDSELHQTLTRGQVLIAVWAGAQSGDKLTLSVSGTKGG